MALGFGKETATEGGLGVEAGTDIAGLGLEAYGAYKGYQASKEANAAQTNIIRTQMKMDALREQMMNVQYGRDVLQTLRQSQQARSLALTNAANKGAQFGSGLQGGYGQIGGATAFGLEGLSQKYQAGQQMFSLQTEESGEKIDLANAQMHQQEASAFGGFGKDLLQAGQAAGKIASLVLI